jgi:hypothetical protein
MGGGELRMPLGQRLRTWHQNGASSSAPSSLGCSGGSYNEGVRLAGKECGGGSNRAGDHSRATSAAR